jgi:NAD(P)-dependent dehydrogenase (short-subunit alcohol dehydrogenase family)
MWAPTPSSSLTPRVAVVSGATRGIGKAVAQSLAARGFTTVLVGRGADRAAAAAAEVARNTGNSRVEGLGVSDLALVSESKRLAAELLARYPAIQLLINNAGAYFAEREVTSEGLERTFALNVLAPFTLTSLMADRLRVSAPARVVQISSAAHFGHSVDLGDLQSTSTYSGFSVYGRSKLELILLTREFARRLAGTGVVVNAVHPGFIRSGFGDNNPGGAGFGVKVAKFLFARSLRYGMQNVDFVATDPSTATISGEYFSRRRAARASEASYDMVTARRLFETCRDLAGTPDLPEPAPAAPSSAAPRNARSTTSPA